MKNSYRPTPTVPFASSLTSFPLPRPGEFTSRQMRIFLLLTAMINDKCIENMEWDGSEETFFDLDIDLSHAEAEEVLKRVALMCKTEDVAVYTAALGDGVWKVGVVASSAGAGESVQAMMAA